MPCFKSFFIYTLGIFMALINLQPAFAQTNSTEIASKVEDLPVKTKYSPGMGTSVGNVKSVQNRAYIIHKGKEAAYLASTGCLLFKKDTLLTGSKGKLRVKLNDQSSLTLRPNTRLTIDRSVYEPESKSRSSFLEMLKGKVRFLIKDYLDYKQSEFKIKTNTAIVGIRGSDFVILSQTELTEVTALKDTQLRVISLAYPDKPVRVTEFKRSKIHKGKLPTEPKKVPRKEIKKLIQEFEMEEKDLIAIKEETVPAKKSKKKDILISKKYLQQPTKDFRPDMQHFLDPLITEESSDIEQEDNLYSDRQNILEFDKQNDEELPTFPETP